jgi:hypothetical protein
MVEAAGIGPGYVSGCLLTRVTVSKYLHSQVLAWRRTAAVAEKHYLEYEAAEARSLLPPDPLVDVDHDKPRKTEVPARAAQ